MYGIMIVLGLAGLAGAVAGILYRLGYDAGVKDGMEAATYSELSY